MALPLVFAVITAHLPLAANPGDTLVGVWELVEVSKPGLTVPKDRLPRATMCFAGKEYLSTQPALTIAGSYTLDTSRQPWRVVLMAYNGPRKGLPDTQRCELTGDTLRLIQGVDGRDPLTLTFKRCEAPARPVAGAPGRRKPEADVVGVWELSEVFQAGVKLAADRTPGVKVCYTGSQYLSVDQAGPHTGSYTVDTSRRPWKIALTLDGAGSGGMPAVTDWELADGTLRMMRPTIKGQPEGVAVFKRVHP